MFGANGEKGVVFDSDGSLRIVDVEEVGEERLLIHQENALIPGHAFALSRLSHTPTGPVPLGVFRAVARPTYEDIVSQQIDQAKARAPGDLAKLLAGGDTWTV
jgi:2-oxoglutarate ferredoxin oxidoreductase subunit beta